jgi:hypothetical protein
VLAGPRATLAFARRQAALPPGSALVDESLAAGGLLVDLRRRELRWFGGGDLLHDVVLRRLCVQAVAIAWRGWHTHWAHGGAPELARRVGLDPVELIDEEREADPPDLDPPAAGEWRACPLTVRHPNGLVLALPLAWERPAEVLLTHGTTWVEDAARRLGARSWRQNHPHPPCGGVHIDLAARTVHVWQAAPLWDAEQRLRAVEGDWNLGWWGSDLDAHLRAAAGVLTLCEDEERVAHRLFRSILADLHIEDGGVTLAALEALRRALPDRRAPARLAAQATSRAAPSLRLLR